MSTALFGLVPDLLSRLISGPDLGGLLQVANFSWFQLLPGVADGHLLEPLGIHDHGGHTAVAVLGAWLVCGFVILLALLGRMGLNRARAQGGLQQYVPSGGFSVVDLFDVFVGAIRNLAGTMLEEHDVKKLFPLFGGLFLYIFFCNALGLLPGMLPPTENISNNFAMASVVLVTYLGIGLGRNPGPFIKHLAGPIIWLAPLIMSIELLGLLVIRPGSLSLRLMGNIVGDHMVLGIMSDLTKAVIPSLFLALGTFVSFLQAFVFTLLSIIYVSMSIVHDDHH